MAKSTELKAFELVLVGHPDKVCDLVSKRICEANKGGRNAIECMWGNDLFVVSGETSRQWDSAELRDFVYAILANDIGLAQYELMGIRVLNNLNVQSPEINAIVGEHGTGDNGIYFGGYHKVYTPVILKMKAMCESLTAKVLSDWNYRTDGKFIFRVDPKGNIVDLTMNIASYAGKRPKADELHAFIRVFTGNQAEISINPKGNWDICFGFADCGLTGRKLACDGSCGLFSHGGGAMHGKDISKADVTVPLYLNYLAAINIGHKKFCEFSASSIIGDTDLKVYKNGKYFDTISFDTMKEFVSGKELTLFGVLR